MNKAPALKSLQPKVTSIHSVLPPMGSAMEADVKLRHSPQIRVPHYINSPRDPFNVPHVLCIFTFQVINRQLAERNKWNIFT